MRQQTARNDEKVIPLEELKRARDRRAASGRTAEAPRLKEVPRAGGQERQPRGQHNKRSQAKPGRFGLSALFVLLALLAAMVVMGMNIFKLREVEVKGNDTIRAKDIITLSGIKLGDNIFKVDTNKARENIERDGLLELLNIERIFPDKIRLNIHQRIPHGAIAYMGRFVIIDEKGCVLDARDELPAGQYPLITGMDIKHSEKGKPIQSNDAASLKAMETVLTALQKQQALSLIAQADFKDLLNIDLLTRDGMVVELEKPQDMDAKALWLSSTIPELRKQGHTKGVLYLTSAKGPVYAAAQQGEQNGTAEAEEEDPQKSAEPADDNQGDGEDTGDSEE
jgi:cell division protein FtsQ